MLFRILRTIRPLLAAAVACGALWQAPAQALTAEQALAMADGDNASRVAAMADAVAHGDGQRTADFLQAMQDGDVQVAAGRAFIVRAGQGVDPVTGQPVPVPEGAEDVGTNNRIRRDRQALAALNLLVGDEATRLDAARAMLKGATPTACRCWTRPWPRSAARPSRPSWSWPARPPSWAAKTPPSAQGCGPAGAACHPGHAPAAERAAGPGNRREGAAALQRALAEVADKLAWGERLGVPSPA
jgi:urea transport system permease protein